MGIVYFYFWLGVTEIGTMASWLWIYFNKENILKRFRKICLSNWQNIKNIRSGIVKIVQSYEQDLWGFIETCYPKVVLNISFYY